jgi:hypothetical protein
MYKYKVNYLGDNYNFILNSIEKSCTCRNYLKYAICHHLVAYSNLNGLNWFDSKFSFENKENFIKKTKRGAKGGSYKRAEKAYHKDN